MNTLRDPLPASRSARSRWRTFVIYLGLGPLIGGALAAVAFFVIGIATDGHLPPGRPVEVALGLAALMGLVVFGGVIFGFVPALLAGVGASFWHRLNEPRWKSILTGLVTGAAGSGIFVLGLTGARGVEALPWLMVPTGAFAGAACGLIQRTKSTPRRND